MSIAGQKRKHLRITPAVLSCAKRYGVPAAEVVRVVIDNCVPILTIIAMQRKPALWAHLFRLRSDWKIYFSAVDLEDADKLGERIALRHGFRDGSANTVPRNLLLSESTIGLLETVAQITATDTTYVVLTLLRMSLPGKTQTRDSQLE